MGFYKTCCEMVHCILQMHVTSVSNKTSIEKSFFFNVRDLMCVIETEYFTDSKVLFQRNCTKRKTRPR